MIMYHLGPQLGVWIMQVSTFSRVLIRGSTVAFNCSNILFGNLYVGTLVKYYM